MKNFIVISAPSGTGKTTICRKLQDQFSELDFSISCTTRQQRKNEINGRDYFFISQDEFEQKISENAFAEYEKVHGNFLLRNIKRYT
jgi:guanylate kinase